MHNSFLRIITWNANGLIQRAHELEIFLRMNNVDIALISETHFTNKNYIRMKGTVLTGLLIPANVPVEVQLSL